MEVRVFSTAPVLGRRRPRVQRSPLNSTYACIILDHSAGEIPCLVIGHGTRHQDGHAISIRLASFPAGARTAHHASVGTLNPRYLFLPFSGNSPSARVHEAAAGHHRFLEEQPDGTDPHRSDHHPTSTRQSLGGQAPSESESGRNLRYLAGVQSSVHGVLRQVNSDSRNSAQADGSGISADPGVDAEEDARGGGAKIISFLSSPPRGP